MIERYSRLSIVFAAFVCLVCSPIWVAVTERPQI